MADSYWVTYPDTPSTQLARSGALIWGPQANPPPQISGMFLAGPFATNADAQAYEKQIGATSVPVVGSVVKSVTGGIFGPLSQIGDFFGRLTQPQTWTRVGEVALGGIVIYAAFRGLTHGSSTVGAGARSKVASPIRKTAKAAVTVAAPEVRYASRTAAKRVAPKTTARVATHRTAVAKYGGKKPYRPPEPQAPRITYRHSIIEHRTTGKPTTIKNAPVQPKVRKP